MVGGGAGGGWRRAGSTQSPQRVRRIQPVRATGETVAARHVPEQLLRSIYVGSRRFFSSPAASGTIGGDLYDAGGWISALHRRAVAGRGSSRAVSRIDPRLAGFVSARRLSHRLERGVRRAASERLQWSARIACGTRYFGGCSSSSARRTSRGSVIRSHHHSVSRVRFRRSGR
jgi:hypothetical protein